MVNYLEQGPWNVVHLHVVFVKSYTCLPVSTVQSLWMEHVIPLLYEQTWTQQNYMPCANTLCNYSKKKHNWAVSGPLWRQKETVGILRNPPPHPPWMVGSLTVVSGVELEWVQCHWECHTYLLRMTIKAHYTSQLVTFHKNDSHRKSFLANIRE